jgi:hypothetical protein
MFTLLIVNIIYKWQNSQQSFGQASWRVVLEVMDESLS